MKPTKRKHRRWPWATCGHVTLLSSGNRLYCKLQPKHTGVHEAKLLGQVITWGTIEPDARYL